MAGNDVPSPAGTGTRAQAPPSDFEKLLARVLALRWRSSPVTATADGVHDFDEQLDRFDPGTLDLQLCEAETLASALRAIPDEALSPDEALDRAAVLGTLEADLHEWREVRSWTFNPAIYPELAIYSCYLLAVRDVLPLEQRLRAIVARLGAVPRLLAEGLANLAVPATVLLDNALQACAGASDLFERTLPLLGEHAAPALRSQLQDGCAAAWLALEQYARDIRQLATSRGTRSFAIGADAFSYRFRHAHGFDCDPERLLSIGLAARERIEDQLREVASEIGGAQSWREQVRELGLDHPPAERLLDAYREDVARVRAFVTARQLATLTDDPLDVVPTPAFERSYLPFAAYLQAGPLDPAGPGLLYVTPVDPALGSEDVSAALAHHAKLSRALLVVHEGYPGHHLQCSRAKRDGSLARLLYGTPLMTEGWALYCEQMMVEQGFVDDPAARLVQLRDALWRAWRVEVDVRLHRGEWTAEQTAERAVIELGFDEPSARAEVARYCAWPTQASTYLVGRELLLDLRDRISAREGSAFQLGRFHDQVLGFGHLSPAAIRGAMLDTRERAPGDRSTARVVA